MAGGKREEAGSSSVYGEDRENPSLEREKDEEEEAEEAQIADLCANFVPPPLVPLVHHLEKDKDDESLRRWKEQLLGFVKGDLNGQVEPEVKFYSMEIMSIDLGENNTPLPLDESQTSKVLFSLQEGSQYRFKLTFTVKYNIVSGLAYSNTVWRAGVQVDQSDGMLGTFGPREEPYVHLLDEETTPSGALARGVYSAKLRFLDDDKKCHMELNYTFEITKRS